MIIDELVNKGVKEENIIVLKLDKRPYKNITTASELEKLIDSKIIGENLKKDIYFYLQVSKNIDDEKTSEREYRPFYEIKDLYLSKYQKIKRRS